MKKSKTLKVQGNIYEYEIDESNFIFIKEGTTFISVGQLRPLDSTENIEKDISEMIKLVLPIKPIK